MKSNTSPGNWEKIKLHLKKYFGKGWETVKAKLAIEIDGNIHDENVEHDRWREEILTGMKINVIRFRNEELLDIEKVLDQIRENLSEGR